MTTNNMSNMVSESLSECGFGSVRFGGQQPAPHLCNLVDVLPLLMHVPDKSKLGLFDISLGKLSQVIQICAGMEVEVRASEALSSSIRVNLEERIIEMSQDDAGGLRDAIYAAVLLRVFYGEGGSGMSFSEILDEARVVILDELPHAMGYSGSSELECTMLESHSIVLKTHILPGSCAIPLPFNEKVIEHREVAIHAA